MKVTSVRIYDHQHSITRYNMSGGTIADLRSTIVEVVTDTGLAGWGEVCPAGPTYQPVSMQGIRAAMDLIVPAVIGLDPQHHVLVNAAMAGALNGTNEAKAAIDIACWDITGKARDVRVCDLMGGPQSDPVPTYHVVSINSPEASATQAAALQAEGHTKLQVKAGGRHLDEDLAAIRAVAEVIEPGVDMFVDVNRGWTVEQTIRVSNLCADLNFAIEQPCATYAECAQAKPHLRHPLLLDESATDLATISHAISSGVANGFGMKISRVGGLTNMRAVRDLCAATHIPTSCDDSWGGDIMAAACVQMGSTLDPGLSRGAWIAAPYIEGHYDEFNGPRIENGTISLPDGAGLGITIPDGYFGVPIATYE